LIYWPSSTVYIEQLVVQVSQMHACVIVLQFQCSKAQLAPVPSLASSLVLFYLSSLFSVPSSYIGGINIFYVLFLIFCIQACLDACLLKHSAGFKP